MRVDTSNSNNKGGVFYFDNVATVAISKVTIKSRFETFKAPIAGSFMYSVAPNLKLHMDDAELLCSLTNLNYPTDTDSYMQTVPTQTTSRGGAHYIQDAIEVLANRNLY